MPPTDSKEPVENICFPAGLALACLGQVRRALEIAAQALGQAEQYIRVAQANAQQQAAYPYCRPPQDKVTRRRRKNL